MTEAMRLDGIRAGRLGPEDLAENFADLHPAYDAHEATVAADRCYFCHDAPCITACPTDIDIPLFIRQIQTGMPEAAGKTIFDQNILGGMCARVCPTETLCEEACVREAAEGKPVQIGRLQRYATDALMAEGGHPYTRAPATDKTVAVIGAGPAGLACAHRLAMLGHTVTLYDSKTKPGGLNEYGIAAYKTPGGFAQAEVDWLLSIGGITLVTGQGLGNGLTLPDLREKYDAVFLGIGLGGVGALGLEGEEMTGAANAVDFIASLRQQADLTQLPVGRHVVVVGGGMTAVDAAVQSKLLGAETVTIAYRRGRDRMPASRFEQDLAASHGVRLMFNVAPVALHGEGQLREVELAYLNPDMSQTGETVTLRADQLFRAIGQKLEAVEGLDLDGGKIAVTGAGRTSLDKVWAGGDCASGGEDLTVTAVAEGRDAAMDIHSALTA
ncbi:dihydropyrimidine dehydrogenase subunit A [Jannaschia pagri]|uniref:Dihydropyrimidine dehydrogenase subunit A n=1 Tax=Jannaschia pagri TaxID=2829797 RepID=A0ABQ4NJH4_9RHOB|nr:MULTISPECIES: NAD(P)-dependent oxidoreductase [unclassified Jannaschia]GIT90700.1 dihydropyrimidine dehydrogenase subunit A [Jannaschia sp. AI_61]GIT94532.1 dihydropyrimidine dehydrogenase subunit A [Jannaschia sp. AI_62]